MSAALPLPLPLDVRLMNLTTATLLTLLVLGTLAAGAWRVMQLPMFDIREIAINGDTQHNTEHSLASAVDGRLQGNFFTLDVAAVRGAFESVPWVRSVRVRREFPNRIYVQLGEYEPVARWGDEEGRLVDTLGTVFDTGSTDDRTAALPRFEGPEGQGARVLEAYLRLSDAVRSLGTRIDRIELQPRGSWRVWLAQGAQVELGHGSTADLAWRMARFSDTAGEVAGRYRREAADIESADLRYSRGYALRLRGVTTVPAQP